MSRLKDVDALNRQIARECAESIMHGQPNEYREGLMMAHTYANALPSIDAEPVKRGVWVSIDDEPHEDFECSVCGYVSTASFDYGGITPNAFPYCPMCGAKMGEGDIDEYAQS